MYRKAPCCYGNDSCGSFFLKYDVELQKDNDWVKVTGTPKMINNGYYDKLYLEVTNIEVLEKCG